VEIFPYELPSNEASARKRWGVWGKRILVWLCRYLSRKKDNGTWSKQLPLVRALHPEVAAVARRRRRLPRGTAGAYKASRADRAVFFPDCKDIAQVYRGLDAFAFPSEFEVWERVASGDWPQDCHPFDDARGHSVGVDGERTALAVEPNARNRRRMLRLINDGLSEKISAKRAAARWEQRFSAGCMVRKHDSCCGCPAENEEGLRADQPALRAVSFCNTTVSIFTTVSAPASHDGRKG